MFKSTCTFASLFHRRNSKCEHNGREAETDEERENEGRELQWWDDELIIQLGGYCWCWWDLLSLFLFFYCADEFSRAREPFIHFVQPLFSARLCSPNTIMNVQKLTQKEIFSSRQWVGLMRSVRVYRTMSETDNLHNNDAMSFTIFDIIFCDPSNGGFRRHHHHQ